MSNTRDLSTDTPQYLDMRENKKKDLAKMTKNEQLVRWEANQKAVASLKPSEVKCFKEEEEIHHVKGCWNVKYRDV